MPSSRIEPDECRHLAQRRLLERLEHADLAEEDQHQVLDHPRRRAHLESAAQLGVERRAAVAAVGVLAVARAHPHRVPVGVEPPQLLVADRQQQRRLERHRRRRPRQRRHERRLAKAAARANLDGRIAAGDARRRRQSHEATRHHVEPRAGEPLAVDDGEARRLLRVDERAQPPQHGAIDVAEERQRREERDDGVVVEPRRWRRRRARRGRLGRRRWLLELGRRRLERCRRRAQRGGVRRVESPSVGDGEQPARQARQLRRARRRAQRGGGARRGRRRHEPCCRAGEDTGAGAREVGVVWIGGGGGRSGGPRRRAANFGGPGGSMWDRREPQERPCAAMEIRNSLRRGCEDALL